MDTTMIIILGLVCILLISVSVGIYFATSSSNEQPLTQKSTQESTPNVLPRTAATNLTIGQSINCNKNDPNGDNTGGFNGGGQSIYRYMGDNNINHYPNPDVAQSWDPNWANPNTIDCLGLKAGPGLNMRT